METLRAGPWSGRESKGEWEELFVDELGVWSSAPDGHAAIKSRRGEGTESGTAVANPHRPERVCTLCPWHSHRSSSPAGQGVSLRLSLAGRASCDCEWPSRAPSTASSHHPLEHPHAPPVAPGLGPCSPPPW